MIHLGIETSCDETSISLLKNNKVISNIIHSQINQHKIYNGVLPELAARLHTKYISNTLEECLFEAKMNMSNIDVIHYTKEPGLPGALQVGEMFSKTLAFLFDKKINAVNHLHAHLFSPFINKEPKYPFIGAVISGGHSSIYIVKSINDIQEVSRTLDDAAGECIDKVSKQMGLGYPGGPIIEKIALKSKDKILLEDLKINIKNKKQINDFSFSGIKSKYIQLYNSKKFSNENIAYSLQERIFSIILNNVNNFYKIENINNISISGGVSCNKRLRKIFKDMAKLNKWNLFFPEKEYTTDNAAMIAYYGKLKIEGE